MTKRPDRSRIQTYDTDSIVNGMITVMNILWEGLMLSKMSGHRKLLHVLLGLIVMSTMLLVACGDDAEPAPAPAVKSAAKAKATATPTSPPAAAAKSAEKPAATPTKAAAPAAASA